MSLSAQQQLLNIQSDKLQGRGSYPDGFHVGGGLAFFRGRLQAGVGLWRTDGTPGGTWNLFAHPNFSRQFGPNEGLYWKKHFYFTGFEEKAGWELFRTDGTVQGTVLFKDLIPGTASSNPTNFASNSQFLFFVVQTGKQQDTLFRSDGTPGGTVPVFSVQNRICSLQPFGSDLLFLVGGLKSTTFVLMRSDGTPKGTRSISPPFLPQPLALSRQSFFIPLGKRFFFSAFEPKKGTGMELWVTDGTVKGTKLFKDVLPGPLGSAPAYLTAFGNRLFFAADNPQIGRELWVSDGTVGGTKLFKDLDPNVIFGRPASGNPQNLVVMGNHLLFTAKTGTSGREPWISDGTAKGTQILKDLVPGSKDMTLALFTVAGKYGFFIGFPNPKLLVLFRTDGTAKGTFKLTDLETFPGNFLSQELVPFGNRVLFQKSDFSHGREPWISDGTLSGTRLVSDVYPGGVGQRGSHPQSFGAMGDRVFFVTNNYTSQNNIWFTKGTAPSTKKGTGVSRGTKIILLGDKILWADQLIPPHKIWSWDPVQNKKTLLFTSSKFIRKFHSLGNRVLFFDESAPRGEVPWVSDGTPKGTVQLKGIPQVSSSTFGASIPLGNRGILPGPFQTFQPLPWIPLWLSDGTAKGTRLLKVLPSPLKLARVQTHGFLRVGKDVFFALDLFGRFQKSLRMLLKSDGTPGGTVALGLFPREGFMSMGTLQGKLYFSAVHPSKGNELWVSDGTLSGTKLFKDLNPGSKGSEPSAFFSLRGRLFFGATTPSKGRELYVSDGTVAGTKLFFEVYPGPLDGFDQEAHFVRIGSRRRAFIGAGPKRTKRIWVTDGTLQGTKPVGVNLPAGFYSYDFDNPSFALGTLFFGWFDHRGVEPWVASFGASARPYGTRCGTRPSLDATDPVLGQKMNLHGSLSTNSPNGILLLGATAPLSRPLSKGCRLYLDPFRGSLALPVQAQKGEWRLNLLLPAQSSLQGLLLQGQVFHPLQGGGFDLSNPVELVLGN